MSSFLNTLPMQNNRWTLKFQDVSCLDVHKMFAQGFTWIFVRKVTYLSPSLVYSQKGIGTSMVLITIIPIM